MLGVIIVIISIILLFISPIEQIKLVIFAIVLFAIGLLMIVYRYKDE
jgi:hypothetical protein